MTEPEFRSSGNENPRQYRIIVRGHLRPSWSEWFEHLIITHEPDGTTSLTGPVVDQAALYGLINKMRDMGLILLSVEVIAG